MMDKQKDYAISVDEIKAAHERLKPIIFQTPLLENSLLNQLSGGRILIKPECLQHTGSFKFRGAYNRLSQLNDQQKEKGVVAFSSGNHAQGIAAAAKILGIKATIVMPHDAPRLKKEKTLNYGATVVHYDRYSECREALAQKIADEKEGAVIVPSFNDPYIMAGQGTVGLEIAKTCLDLDISLDSALICCGGGGLSSGSFLALKQYFPSLQAFCVEPENYDDAGRSLLSGQLEDADITKRSICDALLTQSLGDLPFAVLKGLGARGLAVTDDEVRQAVAFAAQELKLTVEAGGAVALAAILSKKIDVSGQVAAIVLSGGNIDSSHHADIIANTIV